LIYHEGHEEHEVIKIKGILFLALLFMFFMNFMVSCCCLPRRVKFFMAAALCDWQSD